MLGIFMYKINKLQRYIANKRMQPVYYSDFKWSVNYENIQSLCCTSEMNIVNQLFFENTNNLKNEK